MVTTIQTFRGHMVTTYAGALENAKKMLKELIEDGVPEQNQWALWWDENDSLNRLTFHDGTLVLDVSKSIHFNIKLMW